MSPAVRNASPGITSAAISVVEGCWPAGGCTGGGVATDALGCGICSGRNGTGTGRAGAACGFGGSGSGGRGGDDRARGGAGRGGAGARGGRPPPGERSRVV